MTDRPLHTLFIFLLLATSSTFAQLAKTQIKEDLDYLKDKLERHHPNLYTYSSPQKVEDFFNTLADQASASSTQPQAFQLISSTSNIIKDGHTYFQPDKIILDGFYKTSSLLPLDIFWEDHKAYIIRIYGDHELLNPADRIYSINGIDVSFIEKAFLDGVLRDGNNTTYPNWILNNFFRAYFTFFFGSTPKYEIEYGDDNKITGSKTIKGLTHAEISAIRKSTFPQYEKEHNPKDGISTTIDQSIKTAILKIRSFDNRTLKSEYNEQFKKPISDFFKTIKAQGIENLILDLRDNQGGHVTNGIYLLQHLLDQPFQAVESFTKVDKAHYRNPTSRNKTVKGIGIGLNKPFKHNFTGQLYTLINGGSFSNSGIVAHVLNKSNRGKLIGVETAGSAYTLVGEPNKDFTLPHSQIQVTIPTLQFVLQDYKDKDTGGTFPHQLIQPELDDLINRRDPVMEYVRKRINN